MKLGQNNKGLNKEKADGDPPKTISCTPPVEKVEKVIENPEKTDKTTQPNPSLPPPIIIEIQEDDEKKPATMNYYQECLSIIRTFLTAKSSKGGRTFKFQLDKYFLII